MRRAILSLLPLLLAAACARAGERPLQPGLVAVYSDGARRVAVIAPTPNFTLNDKQSLHPALAPKFTAQWDGFVKILRRGEFLFSAECAGGTATVLVDGKEAHGKKLDLTPGEHALRITFERQGGAARLQLVWQSEVFKPEPVPSSVLGHRERPAECDAQAQIERGRTLVEELNCGGCHAGAPKSLRGRPGPDLSFVGSRASAAWIYKWLENPRHFRPQAVMPAMLNEEERRDVAACLAAFKHPAEPKAKAGEAARAEEGKQLFESIGCIACHGEGGVSLSGLGSKSTVGGLTQYLLDPLAFDPSGRMPAFFDPKKEEKEAALIAEYLVQSKNPEFEAAPPPGDPKRGGEVIRARGCLGCHNLQRDPAVAGFATPEMLKNAGITEQSAWKYAGPFDSGGKHQTVFQPEQKLDLSAEYDGAEGKKIKWMDGSGFADGKRHVLFDNRENTITYLYRTVTAGRETEAMLYVGTDDTVTVWINGEKVHEHLGVRGMPEQKDKARARFKAGANTVLMKVTNMGGGYEFFYATALAGETFNNTLQAPGFEKIAAEKGCLADGTGSQQLTAAARGTPRFALSKEDRAGILAFLKTLAAQPEISDAPVHDFYRTVSKLRCAACHELHGSRPSAALTETAPPLTGIGEKLRVNWLEQTLNQKARSRSWMKLRMPHFGKDAVGALAHGFPAMAGIAPGDAPAPAPPTLEQIREGTHKMGKSGLACVACHDFQNHKSYGDIRGVDMTAIFSRVRPEWFRRWMRDPLRIQPGTAMPQFLTTMTDEAAERELDLLWRMLSLGKAMPLPSGLGGLQSVTVAVQDEPVILRGFLPDSSKRSIAVGLPGYISYCYDAESCRLRYAWFGGFLDLAKEWNDRGGGPPQPLGKRFYTAPNAQPLRIGKGGAEPKAKFGGYGLVKGLPGFRYELDGVAVRETITAAPNGLGLARSFEIEANGTDVFYIKSDEKGVSYSASAGTWEGAKLKVPAGKTVKFSVTILVEQK